MIRGITEKRSQLEVHYLLKQDTAFPEGLRMGRLRKGENNMPIEVGSPLWALLADWIKIILTLPDPPPEQLAQVNDVAILTAISALTARLSPELGSELRRALPALRARVAGA